MNLAHQPASGELSKFKNLPLPDDLIPMRKPPLSVMAITDKGDFLPGS